MKSYIYTFEISLQVALKQFRFIFFIPIPFHSCFPFCPILLYFIPILLQIHCSIKMVETNFLSFKRTKRKQKKLNFLPKSNVLLAVHCGASISIHILLIRLNVAFVCVCVFPTRF